MENSHAKEAESYIKPFHCEKFNFGKMLKDYFLNLHLMSLSFFFWKDLITQYYLTNKYKNERLCVWWCYSGIFSKPSIGLYNSCNQTYKDFQSELYLKYTISSYQLYMKISTEFCKNKNKGKSTNCQDKKILKEIIEMDNIFWTLPCKRNQ